MDILLEKTNGEIPSNKEMAFDDSLVVFFELESLIKKTTKVVVRQFSD